MRVLFFILSISLASFSKANDIPTLPSTWYTNKVQKNTEINKSEEKGITDYVDFLFQTQQKLLNTVAKNPLSRNWRLNRYVSDYAVSEKGVMGVSTLWSNSSIRLQWANKNHRGKKNSANDYEVYVEGKMSDKDIADKVDSLMGFVAKEKPNYNIKALRKNLADKIKNFRETVRSLENIPGTNWWVSKFVSVVYARATGRVYYIGTAGGSVNFLLVWKRNRNPDQKPMVKKGTKVYEFAKNMAQTFDLVFGEVGIKNRYKLAAISVGMGMAKNNAVSLTNASGAGALGILVFTPNTRERSAPSKSSLKPIPVMLGNGEGEKERRNRITNVAANKFITGLVKAKEISNFFVARANRLKKTPWYIDQIRGGFEISNNGFLGMSTAKGRALLSLTYRRVE